MIEQNMQAARNFLNEASHVLGLVEEEVNALQKKADDLGPKAEQFDRLEFDVAAKKAELAATEKKLGEVNAAHQKFAKLVTG